MIVADECHHVPAAAFEHAVKQIPARRSLGLTATPYRRDKLDDQIALQVGPIRHTIALSHDVAGQDTLLGALREAGHDPVVLRGGMGAKAHQGLFKRVVWVGAAGHGLGGVACRCPGRVEVSGK